MDDFIRRLASLLVLGMFLSGCMVGPNFHTPPAPDVKTYTAKPLPHQTVKTPGMANAGKPQLYVYNRDLPADWWRVFQSPEIDELVRRGMMNNQNLAAAQAALRVAQETLYAGIGNLLLPAFNANFGGTRQRFAGSTIGNSSFESVFNTFNANASVSYTLDIFGGSRREIESLRAQVNYQQFQVLGTYLTLTTNIVTTAIAIASYDAQIKATQSLILAESNQLGILKKQLRLGGIPGTTVLTQQTLVNQTRATLPPLEKSLSQAKHALATLVGVFPDSPMPTIKLNKLRLPKDIPVSLPSNLVRQRPDVRASEALMHAASAQIGVATANLFPQLMISGNDGWTSSVLSSLFQPTNKAWAMATQITQPIFHGGALFAQRRQAMAAYDQSLALYKETVLQAFQNTADSLRAIEIDARTFRDAKAAERAAYQNYRVTRDQFRDGGVAYINLLNAQQQYQSTIVASIQAQAQRYTDTAALYQSLGGGWWHLQDTQ